MSWQGDQGKVELLSLELSKTPVDAPTNLNYFHD